METGPGWDEGGMNPPKKKRHWAACKIIEDMEDDDTVCPEPPQEHSGHEQQADDDEADDILAPLLALVNKDTTKSSRPPQSRLEADSLLSREQPVVTAKKLPVKPAQSHVAAPMPSLPQPASRPMDAQPPVQA